MAGLALLVPETGMKILERILPFVLAALASGCAAITPPPAGEKIIGNIVYAKRPTGDLHLDLYLPATPAPHPLVIWIHGGGWKFGDKAWMFYLRKLTGQGFAIASVQYRLSGTAKYPAAIDDCRDALRWLEQNGSPYGLDTHHIFLSGASAGGQLSALIALEAGYPQVKAVCVLYPATNLLGFSNKDAPHGYLPDFLGGPVNSKRAEALEGSPVNHVTRQAPPFLIFHGDADTLVPIAQSEELNDKLHAAGVESHLVVLHGKGHGFSLTDAQEREAGDFFLAHMH
jgi:acetyl esterase/lipase